MLHRYRHLLLLVAAFGVACSSTGQPHGNPTMSKRVASAHDQVVATERAFAQTMADRNFKAFTSFLSSEAIFFDGSTVLHGSEAIAATWKPYFDGPTAPFSWIPDNVQVLPSGKLALSTGPVFINGKQVARFNSIWRLDSANTWHIVFDKGEALCAAKP